MNNKLHNIHQIISAIASKLPDSEQHLISKLQQEIELFLVHAQEDTPSPSTPYPDKTSGCYKFGDDPDYYCPHCFDNLQQKIATQRLNRQLRVCPQCRSSLRPLQ